MRFFAEFVLKEFLVPKTYFMAGLIGLTINVLQGNGPLGSWVPYLVPVLVQVLSKAEVAYRNRERDLLARLPQRRPEPVFVTDATGQIILGAGKGWNTITTAGIGSLGDLFGAELTSKLLAEMTLRQEGIAEGSYFSPALGKTYHVHYCLEGEDWLVWLTAVSPEALTVSA